MPRNDGTTTAKVQGNTPTTTGTAPTVTVDKGPRLGSYLMGGIGRNKKTATAIDTTSVTSTSSHQPDVISVFQKKVVEATQPTSAAAAAAAAAVVTPTAGGGRTKKTVATTPAKPKLDPWEWHEKLVSNEAKRSKLMDQRYQSKQIQHAAIQQLVNDAIQETSLAYRWTTSITKIQDEFAQSLTLKETMHRNDTDFIVHQGTDAASGHLHDIENDPETIYNQMVETVTLNDTLPEKVKTIEPDNEDEETENSLAGSFNMDAINEVAVIVTTTTPTKRNSVLDLISTSAKHMTSTSTPSPTTAKQSSSANHTTTTTTTTTTTSVKHQPPVFAISFPNPLCCNDAYYILHKQHEILQQTFSRNGVNQTSIDKIQQMKELAQENESKLHELAGTILQDWKLKEDEIQKLWSSYLSIAIEVLSSVPKTTPMPEWPKSTDTEQKMKYTTGDVWIAEILYRTAVKRQEINFVNEELTLQSLCEMVKDGERQRRARLRQHMQIDVLRKHASVFERVHLAHTEAIESYMSPTTTKEASGDGFTDEYKYLDNDTFNKDDKNGKNSGRNKKQVVTVEKKKLSIKEQIQDIATFIGTTTVWDTPTTTPHEVGLDPVVSDVKVHEKETNHGNPSAEISAVDVDLYVGSFDDDDEGDYDDYEDLPLLKDAIIDPYTIAGSQSLLSNKRKKRKGGSKRKKAVMKTTDLIGLHKEDDKFKITNAVVLDSESSKHAFFMDQLLFTGSLLESHYVQFAAVVGLDDNYSSYLDGGESKSSKKDDMSSSNALKKSGLVIITSDDILHLFEISLSPTISSDNSYNAGSTSGGEARDEFLVVPGCNPEHALIALLKQSANADLVMKEQQDMQALIRGKSSPVSSSPSKLGSFLRAKSITKEETKCFQFNNMTPSLSMSLSECTVRQSLNGQSSVRISHNAINPRIASNKLIFASTTDQHEFMKATRTDVTLWDLK